MKLQYCSKCKTSIETNFCGHCGGKVIPRDKTKDLDVLADAFFNT